MGHLGIHFSDCVYTRLLNIHHPPYHLDKYILFQKHSICSYTYAYSKCTWIAAYTRFIYLLYGTIYIALARIECVQLVIHSVRAIRISKVHGDVEEHNSLLSHIAFCWNSIRLHMHKPFNMDTESQAK